MAVPTMAIYTTPPTTFDFEMNNRSSSSSSTATVSSSQKIVGGLSSLFSAGSDDLPSFRTGEDSTNSLTSCLKRDHFHQSPVSVFHGPVSLTSTPSLRFSSSFRRCVSLADELTFIMDDNNSLNSGSEPYVKDMLFTAQLKHDIFKNELVIKAFYEAAKAHKGQLRASGDPYLLHCVETAGLLATIGANSMVVSAGLLHDTLDDSFMSYDYILQTFGSGLADLVDEVSKLSELSKLARESNTATKKIEADRLHTMFLAMPDARAVLIKLADRLHNMMTLDVLPLSKQYRFAKETMEIFAPLANRLGIVSWKVQLENLCFKYINPQRYNDLSSQLLKSFNQSMVTCAAQKLEQALKDRSVSYHALNWRHKSIYSIHCKMLKKKLSMHEIHDIYGLRLIVENVDDCYSALQLVHGFWSQVPGMFKDYINHPKCNGYQSLHTVVMGEGLVPLEVQIRTKEMHLQAEFGFAAHWRYKEGDCMHPSFVVQMVEWARWVITWQCETMMKDLSSMKPPCKFPSHSEDCPYSYKPSCGSDRPVFVIVIENEKMSVQEFAANSTVKDLITRAGLGRNKWTPYGFPMKQELIPKVNHEPVNDFSCKLRMGDVVEVTPKIPDKSLTEYREEIQRMYESGIAVTNGQTAGNVVGWR